MADEPTGNLDSRTSREVMDLFRQLNADDGITIIVVTHDQEDCAELRGGRSSSATGRVICDTTEFAQATAALHSHEGEYR